MSDTNKREIVISRVFINHKSKAGMEFKNPLVSIYFDSEKGEQKASAFVDGDSEALKWAEGDKLELDFFMNTAKSGKEYLNFKDPSAPDKEEKGGELPF